MNKDIDPAVSEFFREMAKKRKNPYHGFADKELAKEAGKLGAEKRWAGKRKQDNEEKNNPPIS